MWPRRRGSKAKAAETTIPATEAIRFDTRNLRFSGHSRVVVVVVVSNKRGHFLACFAGLANELDSDFGVQLPFTLASNASGYSNYADDQQQEHKQDLKR